MAGGHGRGWDSLCESATVSHSHLQLSVSCISVIFPQALPYFYCKLNELGHPLEDLCLHSRVSLFIENYFIIIFKKW